jgi:beta-ketoacyl-acyl-carrier-protein synthase II
MTQKLNRVVITGLGVISPLGLDAPGLWQNLIAGRSGIAPITLFDASGFDVRIAGEVRAFDPQNYLPAKEARRTDRFAQFAIAALEEALAQARLVVAPALAPQVGVIVGSGVGGIRTYTEELETLAGKGPRRVSPFLIPSITVDVPGVQIALRTGAQGPNFGVASSCATSADAIGQAFQTIRLGHAVAMFAGGFEAAVTPIGIAAFDRMRALSHRNEDPPGASRPFDRDRDGFVMAEGGALLVLEELGFALRRGAQPLAELAAYAATSDAAHMASPDPAGAGSALCMALALQRAGVEPGRVSYINAHGTGTPTGDPAETQAIKTALGEHACRVPVSSTKSMTGHLLGGAGALEAAITILALSSGVIPPTINLDNPDPACDLDCVPWRARPADLEIALSNSFGFGGHNATLVFRRYIGP